MGVRTYGEACAVAHALDLVGERWSLLIVRELLLGPKRFTDLSAGMPGLSQNVLSQRLRELEQAGILLHTKLGPPSGSWVYKLTDWGRDLDSVLVQLGQWGRRSPHRTIKGTISIDALILAMRTKFRPESTQDLDAEYAFRVDGDQFGIRVEDGVFEVGRWTPAAPTAALETDRETLGSLISGRMQLGFAVAAERVRVEGDFDVLDRLFDAVA